VGSKCSQCRRCSRSIRCLTCSDLLPPLSALGSHPPVLQSLDVSVLSRLKALTLYGDLRSLVTFSAKGCRQLESLSISHTPALVTLDIALWKLIRRNNSAGVAALLDPRQRPRLTELATVVSASSPFSFSSKQLQSVLLDGTGEWAPSVDSADSTLDP
jgi:hypothetical protein